MKDAALHCCRTAPGVNNRSLASDLRWQRYEYFTRSAEDIYEGGQVEMSCKIRNFASINRDLTVNT